MANRSIKVGLVQQSCTQDREQNLARSETGIRDAALQGAQLILLPELHTHLYFCQTENTGHFDLAESIPGPTTEALSRLAKELGVVIIGSVFERHTVGIYHNTAVVLDNDGTVAGTYRKMHIPDDPGYYEKFYFTPGDQGFRPIETSIGKLGVLVCWDQWFPEAARLMTLRGADLLLYPTAIGWDAHDSTEEKIRQFDSWRIVQRAHAIANGLPVICCNRTGHETDDSQQTPGIDFWGGSFIAGPQGELLATTDSDSETILVSDLDLTHAEDIRRIWPFLRDRRIEDYKDLARRYGK